MYCSPFGKAQLRNSCQTNALELGLKPGAVFCPLRKNQQLLQAEPEQYMEHFEECYRDARYQKHQARRGIHHLLF